MLSLLRENSSSNPAFSLKDTLRLSEFKRILAERQIRPLFQPIVSLADGKILGYEALSRGPKGSYFENPTALFSAAHQMNCVWDLEMICRTKALEQSFRMTKEHFLFLNIDPAILSDQRFREGVFDQTLQEFAAAAKRIVFEITEGTAIRDYSTFRQVLRHFTHQGYKIAIDDTGAGYAGLTLLAQTNPHYIKIDMELVRNIDKDRFKQALMKALHDFSVMTNIKMIAEGIETVNELNELIHIGIPYGQGYFLQRPVEGFSEIDPEICRHIAERVRRAKREKFHTPVTMPIGELTRCDQGLPPETLGYELAAYFHANPKTMGVCVVEDGRPVGLLMKDAFFGSLATQYGVAVYMNRKISLLMDRDPLIVDYAMPLEQVSKIAISRTDETLYDYIIVTKDGFYYGVITVRRLLEKTTQLEVNRAKHSNPLTGLPGNIMIESMIQQVVAESPKYAMLYFDLDNFKAYNDVYGFESGDKVIALTSRVIQQVIQENREEKFFIGHIGGDDFIAVLSEWQVEDICERILETFDREIRLLYSDADLKRGYILTRNRHGKEERFPLVSLSIAVVTNRAVHYTTPQAIAEAASVYKKKCKLSWKSCYCLDGISAFDADRLPIN